jgi:hypothetical protein
MNLLALSKIQSQDSLREYIQLLPPYTYSMGLLNYLKKE